MDNFPDPHPSRLRSCVYCGARAQVRDHVLPLSKAHLATEQPELRLQMFLVSCCASCNHDAGDQVFSSFEAKAAFLQNRRKGLIDWEELTKTAPIVGRYLARVKHGLYSLNGQDYQKDRRRRQRRPLPKCKHCGLRKPLQNGFCKDSDCAEAYWTNQANEKEGPR